MIKHRKLEVLVSVLDDDRRVYIYQKTFNIQKGQYPIFHSQPGLVDDRVRLAMERLNAILENDID